MMPGTCFKSSFMGCGLCLESLKSCVVLEWAGFSRNPMSRAFMSNLRPNRSFVRPSLRWFSVCSTGAKNDKNSENDETGKTNHHFENLREHFRQGKCYFRISKTYNPFRRLFSVQILGILRKQCSMIKKCSRGVTALAMTTK